MVYDYKMFTLEFVGLFLFIAGFVIGLGAVTVIDLHGFLGRHSSYWTLATTRTHKITKPLIWIGLLLCIVGGLIFYQHEPIEKVLLFHVATLPVMILNGLFLSFRISPLLLQREKEGKADVILHQSLQVQITVSFIFSFICWWGNLLALVFFLTN